MCNGEFCRDNKVHPKTTLTQVSDQTGDRKHGQAEFCSSVFEMLCVLNRYFINSSEGPWCAGAHPIIVSNSNPVDMSFIFYLGLLRMFSVSLRPYCMPLIIYPSI